MALRSKNDESQNTQETSVHEKTGSSIDETTDIAVAAHQAQAVEDCVFATDIAVATPNQPAAAIQTNQNSVALASLMNSLPPLKFGTLPRIRASQGALLGEDNADLGTHLVITIVSYNESYAISPNDDKAPKNLCKFSSDGKNLNDMSGTVSSWVEHLNNLGYAKAAAKRYLEVIGILEDSDKDSEDIGQMVLLSLSPQSVAQFERYMLNATIAVRGGAPEAVYHKIRVSAKRKSFGTNNFTMMNFTKAE